jgi:hypothetical protein
MQKIVACFTLLLSELSLSSPARAVSAAPQVKHCVVKNASDFLLQESYVGHILLQDSNLHHCYGTLISPMGHVLTAAHCVFSSPDNTSSPMLSGMRLCMQDQREMQLSLAYVNPGADIAILKATPNMVPSYGWATFEPGKLRYGEALSRAGQGGSCTNRMESDDFYLQLSCPVKGGDSGEALLSHGRVAGILTRSFGTMSAAAATGYSTFLRLRNIIGAPNLILSEARAADPVVKGSPLDISFAVINLSNTELSGGAVVTVNNAEIGCEVSPTQATSAFITVHSAGEEVPARGGGTVTLSAPVIELKSTAPWSPGEQINFTCRAFPDSLHPVTVHYRAFLDWEDSDHQISEPWVADERDDQGWPVKTLQVGVIDSSDKAWTGGSTVLSDSAWVGGGLSDLSNNFLGYFNYGTSASYGLSTPQIPSFGALLTGLSCGTTYHYQAVFIVFIPYNQTTYSGDDRTFTTIPCPLEEISGLTGSVQAGSEGQTSANLLDSVVTNGSPVVLFFTYGPCVGNTCTDISSTCGFPFIPGGYPFTLGNLTCGTTYHAHLYADTLTEEVRDSRDLIFTTLPCGHKPK